MHTKTWRVALWFPTWAATFEAFCSALHDPNTPPFPPALNMALQAIEAAHDGDWLTSYVCAAEAHELQPSGIWLPLIAKIHARLRWCRPRRRTIMALASRRPDLLSGD